ncbi:hypothetical protein SLEP1_g33262 [Rubroshorea leprosula]|uniref:Uncharacterized protein n=1 Tax=Rubroshorea leprosula TaxID=152421 RepID=A0AAV5KG18_9ROSI|nr:hypothetical protein SLEP1_g33262 [Rubroshorea leprosula]
MVESRLLEAAAGSGEMEVQRAGSGSCSRLYGQKFEELGVAKSAQSFAAGSREKQNVLQTRIAGSESVSRLCKGKPALLTILQLEVCVLQSI